MSVLILVRIDSCSNQLCRFPCDGNSDASDDPTPSHGLPQLLLLHCDSAHRVGCLVRGSEKGSKQKNLGQSASQQKSFVHVGAWLGDER